ncbi:hypothetical protein CGLO_02683 [Colletotrichum gloeosporioides Cg-14]|uniref:Uncharacterized protein n=1 Tax=Colletotrichum gloeosporioides (strain Cg-14) TaxID=1237896 RepID=T0KYB3_COLGC|nr:hypothetical protein CGLO_02683 [Colletotrichum gloeosporioides Cg-14]
MARHIIEVAHLHSNVPCHSDCAEYCVAKVLPTMANLAKFKDTPQWAIADPAHRACELGHGCSVVSDDKFCVRTIWHAKLNHAYGRCGPHTNSPGHALCRDFSEAERQLYPSCADCGVLVELKDLILVHLRLLEEEDDDLFLEKHGLESGDDLHCIRSSLIGYSKTFEKKLLEHAEDLLAGLSAVQAPGGFSSGDCQRVWKGIHAGPLWKRLGSKLHGVFQALSCAK